MGKAPRTFPKGDGAAADGVGSPLVTSVLEQAMLIAAPLFPAVMYHSAVSPVVTGTSFGGVAAAPGYSNATATKLPRSSSPVLPVPEGSLTATTAAELDFFVKLFDLCASEIQARTHLLREDLHLRKGIRFMEGVTYIIAVSSADVPLSMDQYSSKVSNFIQIYIADVLEDYLMWFLNLYEECYPVPGYQPAGSIAGGSVSVTSCKVSWSHRLLHCDNRTLSESSEMTVARLVPFPMVVSVTSNASSLLSSERAEGVVSASKEVHYHADTSGTCDPDDVAALPLPHLGVTSPMHYASATSLEFVKMMVALRQFILEHIAFTARMEGHRTLSSTGHVDLSNIQMFLLEDDLDELASPGLATRQPMARGPLVATGTGAGPSLTQHYTAAANARNVTARNLLRLCGNSQALYDIPVPVHAFLPFPDASWVPMISAVLRYFLFIVHQHDLLAELQQQPRAGVPLEENVEAVVHVMQLVRESALAAHESCLTLAAAVLSEFSGAARTASVAAPDDHADQVAAEESAPYSKKAAKHGSDGNVQGDGEEGHEDTHDAASNSTMTSLQSLGSHIPDSTAPISVIKRNLHRGSYHTRNPWAGVYHQQQRNPLSTASTRSRSRNGDEQRTSASNNCMGQYLLRSPNEGLLAPFTTGLLPHQSYGGALDTASTVVAAARTGPESAEGGLNLVARASIQLQNNNTNRRTLNAGQSFSASLAGLVECPAEASAHSLPGPTSPLQTGSLPHLLGVTPWACDTPRDAALGSLTTMTTTIVTDAQLDASLCYMSMKDDLSVSAATRLHGSCVDSILDSRSTTPSTIALTASRKGSTAVVGHPHPHPRGGTRALSVAGAQGSQRPQRGGGGSAVWNESTRRALSQRQVGSTQMRRNSSFARSLDWIEHALLIARASHRGRAVPTVLVSPPCDDGVIAAAPARLRYTLCDSGSERALLLAVRVEWHGRTMVAECERRERELLVDWQEAVWQKSHFVDHLTCFAQELPGVTPTCKPTGIGPMWAQLLEEKMCIFEKDTMFQLQHYLLHLIMATKKFEYHCATRYICSVAGELATLHAATASATTTTASTEGTATVALEENACDGDSAASMCKRLNSASIRVYQRRNLTGDGAALTTEDPCDSASSPLVSQPWFRPAISAATTSSGTSSGASGSHQRAAREKTFAAVMQDTQNFATSPLNNCYDGSSTAREAFADTALGPTLSTLRNGCNVTASPSFTAADDVQIKPRDGMGHPSTCRGHPDCEGSRESKQQLQLSKSGLLPLVPRAAVKSTVVYTFWGYADLIPANGSSGSSSPDAICDALLVMHRIMMDLRECGQHHRDFDALTSPGLWRRYYRESVYPNGDQYHGYWRGEQRCGLGTYAVAAAGLSYVGGWEADLPHGNGMLLCMGSCGADHSSPQPLTPAPGHPGATAINTTTGPQASDNTARLSSFSTTALTMGANDNDATRQSSPSLASQIPFRLHAGSVSSAGATRELSSIHVLSPFDDDLPRCSTTTASTSSRLIPSILRTNYLPECGVALRIVFGNWSHGQLTTVHSTFASDGAV